MSKRGFTKFSHTLLNGLLSCNLNVRQMKVVLLIQRLTIGCHREWAKLRQNDFMSAGIGPSHIKEVKEPLLTMGVIIQNGNRQEYRINEEYFILNNSFSEKLIKLVGKNLKSGSYQVGNVELTNPVFENFPRGEGLPSHSGNITSLELASLKDNTKDKIKNNDKDMNIGYGQKNYKEIIQNPSSKKESDAVTLWEMLEPNKPDNFGLYLKAVNHVSLSILYQCAREIQQDERVLPVNRGRLFNFKVSRLIMLASKQS